MSYIIMCASKATRSTTCQYGIIIYIHDEIPPHNIIFMLIITIIMIFNHIILLVDFDSMECDRFHCELKRRKTSTKRKPGKIINNKTFLNRDEKTKERYQKRKGRKNLYLLIFSLILSHIRWFCVRVLRICFGYISQ